jgi:hypothetical protein
MADLFANVDILEHIFAFTEAVDLLRLSRTRRAVHNAYQVYSRRAFDVNRRLARFFRDPIEFRSRQARGGTLISGSFALQFFDRTLYPESDLDLYLHHGEAKEMGKFLAAEGYKYVPRRPGVPPFELQEPRGNSRVGEVWEEAHTLPLAYTNPDGDYENVGGGISRVYNFERDDGNAGMRKVQLLVAHHTPMNAILNFHSSEYCI